MNSIDYPKAKEADICLILEGTYPFVQGGVSNWVHELIAVFPQYRFAAIFLGTRAEDYDELCYPLAKNLVHLEMHYLFEKKEPPECKQKDIDSITSQKIEMMHDKCFSFISDDTDTMAELFELLAEKEKMNEGLFLRSKASWEMITKKYSEHYPDQSFFDYFWSVRNLHQPFWKMREIINNVPKFKVIHSASTGYAGFIGALLQKKYSIPYILTEHGIYTKERWIELMRHYFFEHAGKKNHPINSDNALITIWTRFFSILAKVGYCAANPIISLTENHRGHQLKDGAKPDRTQIISYGIDFENYPFLAKKKPNKNKPIIACIGRVVPIKDIKTFIRAFAIIQKTIPAAEAWIVGSTVEDEGYVASCNNLIKILGLENKVKLTGLQDMMDIYAKIDLLVLSSISEGTPFVMLECFAVGIPVVSTNVGGCGELIYGKTPEDQSNGAAGRLVQIADPTSMANAAIELLMNESAWVEAQQVGLTRVKTYYGMKKLIENYGLIYEEAISHGRNRV